MENIVALYRTAGSLADRIDDDILGASSGSEPEKVNMSKLF
jgi:hypothetical protein